MLVGVRKTRMGGQLGQSRYADIDAVTTELDRARTIMRGLGCVIINTRTAPSRRRRRRYCAITTPRFPVSRPHMARSFFPRRVVGQSRFKYPYNVEHWKRGFSYFITHRILSDVNERIGKMDRDKAYVLWFDGASPRGRRDRRRKVPRPWER